MPRFCLTVRRSQSERLVRGPVEAVVSLRWPHELEALGNDDACLFDLKCRHAGPMRHPNG